VQFKKIFALILALITVGSVLASISREVLPQAHALYPLEDGTVLDPGSHGLVIESIEVNLIDGNPELEKQYKHQWMRGELNFEIRLQIRNDFPVDLYNLSFQVNYYDEGYKLIMGNFAGNTRHESTHTMPDIKSGEKKTCSVYAHLSPSDKKSASKHVPIKYPPKYICIKAIHFCSKDQCHLATGLQSSPYAEISEFAAVQKIWGEPSIIESFRVSSYSSNFHSWAKGINVEKVECTEVDPASVYQKEALLVFSHGKFYGSTGKDWEKYCTSDTHFSEEDRLYKIETFIQSLCSVDVQNPLFRYKVYNDSGALLDVFELQYAGILESGQQYSPEVYYYFEDITDTLGVIEAYCIKSDPISISPTFSAGNYHTVYVKFDGTVGTAGYTSKKRCDVKTWQDIIAVDASSHTVGLKADGTVVATGPNGKKQCNVSLWKDIVAVSAGEEQTVGLKSDGTVVAVGNHANNRLNISAWKDIIAIDTCSETTYGLKSDGTVVAAGSNSLGQANISDWENITAISAGGRHVVGLKSDGTVVAAGGNSFGECDVEGWTDIVAVAAGNQFTVGLKSDGTVVATGNNKDGQCDVENWTDIAAVSAGMFHTVGVREDGSYITAGSNGYGQCDLK